jgi:hypothetical protein
LLVEGLRLVVLDALAHVVCDDVSHDVHVLNSQYMVCSRLVCCISYLAVSSLDKILQVILSSILGVDRIQILSPVTMVSSISVYRKLAITHTFQAVNSLSTIGVIQIASKPMPLI